VAGSTLSAVTVGELRECDAWLSAKRQFWGQTGLQHMDERIGRGEDIIVTNGRRVTTPYPCRRARAVAKHNRRHRVPSLVSGEKLVSRRDKGRPQATPRFEYATTGSWGMARDCEQRSHQTDGEDNDSYAAQRGPESALRGGTCRCIALGEWCSALRGFAPSHLASWRSFGGPDVITSDLALGGAYDLSDGVIAIWLHSDAYGGDAGPRWWRALSGLVRFLAASVGFGVQRHDDARAADVHAVWAIIHRGNPIWGAIALRKCLQHAWAVIHQWRAVDCLRLIFDGAAGRRRLAVPG